MISVLKGAVVGGGLELASTTHIRVAETSTFYALPEGQHGLFVGGGGSVRIPRLIGAHRMADMMLTGRVLTAEEGHALGLSHYLTGPGEGLAQGAGAGREGRRELTGDELRRAAGASADHPGRPGGGLPAGVVDGRGGRQQHRGPDQDAGVPRRPRRKGATVMTTPMAPTRGSDRTPELIRPVADDVRTGTEIGRFLTWLDRTRGLSFA